MTCALTVKAIPLTPKAPLVNYAIYTIGDLSSGIYSVVPSILLMFYMTNVLGIPVALATMAAFVPKIVDLVSNAIIAALSDRTNAQIGRRRPWMLAGSLMALPTFAAIWLSPFADPTRSAYFVLITFSLCTVAFSCFLIPFFALNAELPRDYHDRTRLNSYRTAYTCLGMVFSGAGAPLLVQAAGGGRMGYRAMGLVMGVVMLIVTLVTFLAAREPQRPADEHVATLRETFDAIRGNRPFLFLFTAYFIYITTVGVFGAVLAYFVIYILGRGPGILSLMFFVKYSSSIVFVPFWGWLSRRVGKLTGFYACLTLVIASSVGYAFFQSQTPLPIIIAAVVVYGVGNGAVQVFAFSMLADCIQHGNESPGAKTSGAMFNGVFIAGEKLGFATGALLSGAILGATGLVETTQGSVPQPHSALDGIRVSLSLLPIVLNVLALFTLHRYRPFERRMLAHNALQAHV